MSKKTLEQNFINRKTYINIKICEFRDYFKYFI